MHTSTLAPIILFTYNRPWHTKQTLDALVKNDLASDSVLYIYSDGPKLNASVDQINKIKEVREIIHAVVGFKDVIIVESDVNKGLANSIISGVTEVINIHEKVIVLEDDLITHQYFLSYMNKSLVFYSKYNSVFSICADRPFHNKMKVPSNYEYDVFVSLRFFSYGWATWKNRWEHINWNIDQLEEFLKKKYQIDAFNRGGYDLTSMLIMQVKNQIDSWAIRFDFAHFYHHAIAILPCNSYIFNIGNDGSGTHTGINISNNQNYKNLYHNPDPKFINVLYEDKRIINAFYSSFYPKKRPIWKKIINRISRMLGGKNIFVIKKKIYC